MKYIYRIIFMPVVGLGLFIISVLSMLNLLRTGKMMTQTTDSWLADLVDKTVMPLIRLME